MEGGIEWSRGGALLQYDDMLCMVRCERGSLGTAFRKGRFEFSIVIMYDRTMMTGLVGSRSG